MDLAIKNGRVYASGKIQNLDIFVRNGRVAALGGDHRADQEIDAKGLLVLPGAIDSHVHFRDPGQTHKEDWLSGSTSAIAGGVTTVVDQPNTIPPTWTARSFRLKLEIARRASVVDFCLNGGPGEMEELIALGAAAIGEVFTYQHTGEELGSFIAKADRLGALLTIHAEDGTVIERSTAPLLHLQEADSYSRARPPEAETKAIEDVLTRSRRAHICHISTGEGLALLRSTGPRITCEVTPHHLIFSRRDYRSLGTFLKTNPPMREAADNEALWAGLRRGEIDIVASDHAPHLPEEKGDDLWEAPPGVPGVETMLPLMLMAVRRNLLALDRMVDCLSRRPAEILGLKAKGEIMVGKDADLVLVNTREPREIKADRLHSKADWTPYEGKRGIFPTMTLIRGIVVWDDDLCVRPGYGRFLPGTPRPPNV